MPLAAVKDIGEQKCLAFNSAGDMLACGGDDGSLRLFAWPSLERLVFKEKLCKDSIQVGVVWTTAFRVLLLSLGESSTAPRAWS
eukprot:scaffold731_cov328-Prasinococcus_capsulatus_cf.AAC.6